MSATEIGKGRFLRLLDRDSWEFAHRPNVDGVVVVLAVTDKRELVVIEQFRPAQERWVIELPAGLVESGGGRDSLLVAAATELREEAGYVASRFSSLISGLPSPGMTTERVHLLRAHDIDKVCDGGGDEDETIKVHLVPLDSIMPWIREMQANGRLVDLKLFSALYFL